MKYIGNTGISATKSELKALLDFAGPSGDEEYGAVAITVDGKRLLAAATDGQTASIFHTGEVDAEEGANPQHTWQIQRFALEAIAKLAGTSDEIIIGVDKKGHLGRVTIRDIESGESRVPDINVGACSSEQLTLSGMGTPPPIEERGTHVGHVILTPAQCKRLPSVAKAAGTDLFAVYPPAEPEGQVLCVFDEPESVLDGSCHRWVVALVQASESKLGR